LKGTFVEFLVATAIGVMTMAGVYLVLRPHTFSIVLGLTLLTYAVNFFIFASGRLSINRPDIITDPNEIYADPLPQALVLTAIVISFGMTAMILVMSVRSYFESGSDLVGLIGSEEHLSEDQV
jgi:multicomponent K+:H+ antiporter subunit C